MSVKEIADLIEAQGRAWENHKKMQSSELEAMRDQFTEIEKKVGRPDWFGSSTESKQAPAAQFIDTKSGKIVPVLKHGQSLAALESASADQPSMGRLLRGIVLGGRAADAADLEMERKALGVSADPSGGYTVSGVLASQWIDALRANMVLSKAGALTLPMDAGQVSIAKVTGDPEVFWHSENADLSDGDPTFGAANLSAKTAVCLVRFSLELSQDSANLEQILQSTIVNAMAGAIDSAGLNGVSTGAAAAPSGILNLSGRNSVTAIGTPANWDFLIDGMYELAADNVPLENIGGLIAHPKLWKNQAKLKTGITSDETSLIAPADAASLPKLWTTAAPEGTGIIADWRDLIFGVRKNITVRVLSESFMGSNLQLAVLAYARVDFAGVRPASFCTLEGLTYV
jgi:HK97 family phage major capsid protein